MLSMSNLNGGAVEYRMAKWRTLVADVRTRRQFPMHANRYWPSAPLHRYFKEVYMAVLVMCSKILGSVAYTNSDRGRFPGNRQHRNDISNSHAG